MLNTTLIYIYIYISIYKTYEMYTYKCDIYLSLTSGSNINEYGMQGATWIIREQALDP